MKHNFTAGVKLLVSSTLVILAISLTGCVTETNDPLAQNRDPEKAARTYVEAGIRYLQKRQMADAHRTLKRAYDIAPDDPAVNNAYGLFYNMEGEPEQAEKYFKAALSSDPDFSQARNNYAAYLFEHGRFEEAVDQLERVTKDYRYQRRFTAFENLGVCYLKLGETEKAKSAFNRALQLNPQMPVSVLEMAEISMEEGNNQMAGRYLKHYESFAQPSPRQLWLGIQLQRVLGDKDKLASYELALKNLFPGSKEYKAYKESL
ncbi:MAG: type IV pilus biogenesis/stability protein PilW [Pseudomonadales bacterium]|nr:type IV pilus biogenesis/stability protein PilW [Pseudomonadales bacterium]